MKGGGRYAAEAVMELKGRAGPAPGCGSWSAAISTASTPSGMAAAASVVMTLPASRSGRREPVLFIERPTHGVKQLRPSHVSTTVSANGSIVRLLTLNPEAVSGVSVSTGPRKTRQCYSRQPFT